MTTFYCDYEGGNDANAGTSFALRWKTLTTGATAARIAPGDEIRVMGSPDPTSLGQTAKWTNGPLQPTFAIVSSTNTTPIVVTLSGANYTLMAPAVGDTIIVNGHTTNTKANGVWKISAVNGSTTITLVNADGTNSVGNGVGGASGTVRKFNNAVVELTTAVTKNIAACGNQGVKGNWTPSTNVTNTVITTDFKEGGECQQIAISAAFTTGIAAYFPTGTLNLSGYQQVSFWIKQTAGTLGAANSVSLKLCSDTAGVTAVNTINIPGLGALNQWSPITVDLATNLGSSIQSIALYVNTDNAAQTFLLDNIIACKASSSADSLTLTSLISKNTTDEAWFGIQSINGTRIVLDGTTNSIPSASPQRGYSGTTETATLYKRDTTKTLMATAAGSNAQMVQDAGTAGNLITFSGGWNRTDMSAQIGETWFDGQNGLGIGLGISGKAFIGTDRLNFVRYSIGAQPGTDGVIGEMAVSNTTGIPISSGNYRLAATKLSAVCCGGSITPGPGSIIQRISRADSPSSGAGVAMGEGSWIGEITQANNSSTYGVTAGVSGYIGVIAAAHGNTMGGYATASNSTAGFVIANNNTTYGVVNSTNIGSAILGGSTSGNFSGGVGNTTGEMFLRNVTIGESAETQTPNPYADGRIYSENHDGVAGASKIFCDGGLIQTQSTTVHGSAARAWKFSPTSTNRRQYYPLNLVIAKVACSANALVTISAWMQRDNTGLTGQIVCKGGQVAGVTSDVTSAMTAAANTWEQRTITFTPTEAGVVEIEAQFWGGSTYNGYVSDLSISQA